MSRGEVIVTPISPVNSVYIPLAISTPPFYQLVVVKRGLILAPFSDLRRVMCDH